MVLLDIMMSGIDGYEICRRIKASRNGAQVVMVSAMSSAGQQLRAFEAGADDYLVKPFDSQDLRARVRLHFQLREAMAGASAIRAEIESHNSQLRELAEQHTRDVIAIQDTAVFTLAKVAESRDQETGGHLTRMRAYSQILAEELAREGPYADQIRSEFHPPPGTLIGRGASLSVESVQAVSDARSTSAIASALTGMVLADTIQNSVMNQNVFALSHFRPCDPQATCSPRILVSCPGPGSPLWHSDKTTLPGTLLWGEANGPFLGRDFGADRPGFDLRVGGGPCCAGETL